MASWSRRRRSLYAIVAVIFIIGAIVVPSFLIFYKAPTCFDGTKNGSETGVDCGGACQKLCASSFLPPSVSWTRFEQVAPGLYNIASYVINPNTDGEAVNVPYHITVYDKAGVLISDLPGKVTIPPHRNTLVFLGAVNLEKRIPARAVFEFTAAPDWTKKSDTLSSLQIGDKKYSEEGSSSSLTVTLKNGSVQLLGHFAVYAVLYDKDGNALGFSKTLIDGIDAQGSAVAPFTWPVNRHDTVISIEVLPVAE